MGTPSPQLMRVYDTESFYLQKLAEPKSALKKALPLAAAVALPILGLSLMRSAQKGLAGGTEEARAEEAYARLREAQRGAGDRRNLRAARGYIGRYEPPGPALQPLDFELRGAEKNGSALIAAQIGRDLAKEAGLFSSAAKGVTKLFSRGGKAYAGSKTGFRPQIPGYAASLQPPPISSQAINKVEKGVASAKKMGKKVVGATPLFGKGSWKGQAAGLGLAGASAYGLYKGTKGAHGFMSAPARSTAKNPLAGAAPPRYVNQWGVPVHS